jgi:hypothetical protein
MIMKTKEELPIDVARRNLCFVETRKSGNIKAQAQLEMMAFLDFMHPEMSLEDRFKLSRLAE